MKRSLEERLIHEEFGLTLGKEEVGAFLERLAEDPHGLGLKPERVAAFLQRLGREVDGRPGRGVILRAQRVGKSQAASLKVLLPRRSARGKSKVRATKVK